MSKEKFGPRACVRELKTFQDVDWFVSNHKWLLISREPLDVYSKEIYLTPSGAFIAFILDSKGGIKTTFREEGSDG